MKHLATWAVFLVVLTSGCARHEPAGVGYPYHHPLTSAGAKLGGLPPAVQSTIRAQAGATEIYDILKRIQPGTGRVIYEVRFRDPVLFPPLYVEPDGTVLHPDMTVAVGAGEDSIGALSGGPVRGVKPGDLPANVVKTIQEEVPTGEIAYISKDTYGGQVFYEVSFKDQRRHRMLRIAEDGMLVEKSFNPK